MKTVGRFATRPALPSCAGHRESSTLAYAKRLIVDHHHPEFARVRSPLPVHKPQRPHIGKHLGERDLLRRLGHLGEYLQQDRARQMGPPLAVARKYEMASSQRSGRLRNARGDISVQANPRYSGWSTLPSSPMSRKQWQPTDNRGISILVKPERDEALVVKHVGVAHHHAPWGATNRYRG
jgi:hypothetical protein